MQYTVEQIKTMFQNLLETAIADWPSDEKLVVEQPRKVEGYLLTDATGAILITTGAEKFSDPLHAQVCKQKRDTIIGIFTVVRASAKQTSEYYGQKILELLSGVVLDSVARDDKMIFCKEIQFVDEREDNTIWYSLVFVVPHVFVKL